MYVMQEVGLSWEDALSLVQNRRYCISPNGGFLTQMKVYAITRLWSKLLTTHAIQEYEAIYRAQNALQSYPQQQRLTARRKREDDDDADDLR